jgi:hypothetical protein
MMQLSSATVRFIMQRKWVVTLIVCVGVFMSSLGQAQLPVPAESRA